MKKEFRVYQGILLQDANQQGGGGQGTTDYNDLSNKPKIDNVVLSGNQTAESLGLTSLDVYTDGMDKVSSEIDTLKNHTPNKITDQAQMYGYIPSSVISFYYNSNKNCFIANDGEFVLTIPVDKYSETPFKIYINRSPEIGYSNKQINYFYNNDLSEQLVCQTKAAGDYFSTLDSSNIPVFQVNTYSYDGNDLDYAVQLRCLVSYNPNTFGTAEQGNYVLEFTGKTIGQLLPKLGDYINTRRPSNIELLYQIKANSLQIPTVRHKLSLQDVNKVEE